MLECEGCHRFVRVTESSCPFCAIPVVVTSAVGLARMPTVALAAGLSLLACDRSGSDEAGEGNEVTTNPSTSETTAGDGDGDTSTAGDGDGDTSTAGDGDGDTQETLDYSGSDYGGPPPCDALENSIPINVGSNPINTTMSGNWADSACGDRVGTGPDEILQFIAPAEGHFVFAVSNATFDAWLLEFGYYCYAYGGPDCVLNQGLEIDMYEGETLHLIIDGSTDGGGTASVDVTQG
jgi:hypothetical protein